MSKRPALPPDGIVPRFSPTPSRAQLRARLEALHAKRPRAAVRFDLEKVLFGPQLDFVRDPRSFADACCSRQAGKSTGIAAWLLDGPLGEGSPPSLYLTRTRKAAKRIIWQPLIDLNRTHDLGYVPNASDLVLKRGDVPLVYVGGVDTQDEIDKWRGTPWGRVAIDEAQSLPEHVRDLVENALMPSLMRHRGKIRLIGTPAPVPVGYFYEVTQSPRWSHHAWTMWENPYLPDPQATLDEVLATRGMSVEDPSVQREWFGRWVLDRDSLVIQFDSERNVFDELPPCSAPWQYVFGVDLGYDDADAIAVLAFNADSPNVYLVEESVVAKQTISSLVEVVRDLVAVYAPQAVVWDTGGLGKKVADEVSARTGLALKAAEKSRKFEFLALMNDALRTGRLLVRRGSRFAADALLVEWDRDRSTNEHPVISERFHSDVCFVAGTMVATSTGERAIETLVPGDLVWTREGLRPVVRQWCMGTKPIVRAILESGRELVGTPDHRVWVGGRGWVPLSQLTPSDVLVTLPGWRRANSTGVIGRRSAAGSAVGTTRSSGPGDRWRRSGSVGSGDRPRRSAGTGSRGGDGPALRMSGIGVTTPSAACTFIARSGKRRTGPFRRGCTFTTATGTGATIGCGTLSASAPARIFASTGAGIELRVPRSLGGTSRSPESPQANGMDRRLGSSGTASTAARRGGIAAVSRTSVSSAVTGSGPDRSPRASAAARASRSSGATAGSTTLRSSVRSAASRSSGTGTRVPAVVPGRVQRVERIESAAPVYALSVDDVHEFFASGVLVANCDAVLYAFRESYHWTHQAPAKVAAPGSPEWFEAQAARMREEAEERVRRQRAALEGRDVTEGALGYLGDDDLDG